MKPSDEIIPSQPTPEILLETGEAPPASLVQPPKAQARNKAGQKQRHHKLRAYLRYGWEVTRPKKALAVLQPEVKPLPRTCGRHVILVHGHNCLPSFLNGLQRSLRGVAGADEWRFWQVEYDTHWKPFTRSAREIVRTLDHQGYDFSEAILVGYSMGGVVARQMVADGFPCRALLALCSPHLGYVPWLPFGDPGTLSIWPFSRRLHILNRHPRDRAARSKYHFLAADYTDMFGYHPHDGLITRRSAWGETLGPLGSRMDVHLTYHFPPGIDPHIRVLRHQYLKAVLEICEKLFSTHEGEP